MEPNAQKGGFTIIEVVSVGDYRIEDCAMDESTAAVHDCGKRVE
jgi:hypothetical protein